MCTIRILDRVDRLAGGVAAVGFALLVFPLGLSPWLAIPLAVATYVGVALLDLPWPTVARQRWGGWPHDDVRQATPEELAYHRAFEEAIGLADLIRDLAPEIATPAVRDQVGRIVGRI